MPTLACTHCIDLAYGAEQWGGRGEAPHDKVRSLGHVIAEDEPGAYSRNCDVCGRFEFELFFLIKVVANH